MEMVVAEINFVGAPRHHEVTYTAELPVREETVWYLARLL